MGQLATQVARKNIAKAHQKEFEQLREIELKKLGPYNPRETQVERSNRYSKTGSKAKTILARKYPEEYRKLFEEARNQGYPASSQASAAKSELLKKQDIVVIRGIGTAVWHEECNAYHLNFKE